MSNNIIVELIGKVAIFFIFLFLIFFPWLIGLGAIVGFVNDYDKCGRIICGEANERD